MGLLDILNGMQNGPRGQTDPNQGGGGMSPITMAMLGLLAYKAYQKISSPQADAVPAGTRQRTAPGDAPANAPAESSSGGLGGLVQGGLGGLGGLLAGGAAGGALAGGLQELLKQFDQSGHGDVAKSWVGTGQNKSISPTDLEHALGDDTVNSLAEQAGLSKVALLQGLSEQLPGVVDQMTPQGRVPTEQEMSKMI